MTTMIVIQSPSSGPRPATGLHAESLADLENQVVYLQRLIQAEREGRFDGLFVNQAGWIGGDRPLLFLLAMN